MTQSFLPWFCEENECDSGGGWCVNERALCWQDTHVFMLHIPRLSIAKSDKERKGSLLTICILSTENKPLCYSGIQKHYADPGTALHYHLDMADLHQHALPIMLHI